MSFAFNAAPFSENLSKETNYIQQKREAKNKTFKRRDTNSNIESMIQRLHKNNDSNDNSEMSDFNPISPPHSESVTKTIERQTNMQESQNKPHKQNSNLINNSIYETFEQRGINSSAADYYQQYIPTYYNKMSESGGGSKELLDKLNYMIHLLEEQQEEKTGHVTEEIILYSFLGVFLIFIVDSFARAGKYMR
jgi:hypothetical protein